MAADTASASAQGFFCSTSGTTFTDKESLTEHYKSDYHRYNLKRKVAGLPPVTKEWFEARKAQLASVTTSPHQKVWYDPLTKRKFGSENTYLAHVNSKKYQDLVRRSGEPAPPPLITLRKKEDGECSRQLPGLCQLAPCMHLQRMHAHHMLCPSFQPAGCMHACMHTRLNYAPPAAGVLDAGSCFCMEYS
jgi:hypothetical protein